MLYFLVIIKANKYAKYLRKFPQVKDCVVELKRIKPTVSITSARRSILNIVRESNYLNHLSIYLFLLMRSLLLHEDILSQLFSTLDLLIVLFLLLLL